MHNTIILTITRLSTPKSINQHRYEDGSLGGRGHGAPPGLPQRNEDAPRGGGLEKKTRLKWGVGKLIAHSPMTPRVIPFHHTGMEEVLPIHKVHEYTHTCAYIYIRLYTNKYTYRHKNIQTNSYPYPHTYIHTHTYIN